MTTLGRVPTTDDKKTECARCDNALSKQNHSPDRLCGYCQRELAPHHKNSGAFKEWVARGRKREITRAKPEAVPPTFAARSAVPPAIDAVKFLHEIDNDTLIAELRRRAEEAQKLLRIVPPPPATDDEQNVVR